MLKFFRKLLQIPAPISLTVIFLEYDREKHGGSENVFKTLRNYLSNITIPITYLRVDNKTENAPLKKVTENTYTIGGDNRFREFSGWQKGFEHLNQIQRKTDLILFANDMFLAPGESFLKDYATNKLLEKSLTGNSVIGRIDSTGQHYTVYDHDVSQWICTNCFLVPTQAVETLESLVSIKDNLDDFLSPNFPTFPNSLSHEELALSIFQENAPINDTYKLWLVEWLTQRWHSKFEINSDNWNLFRSKVRNILNESILTARLKKLGLQIESYGNKGYY